MNPMLNAIKSRRSTQMDEPQAQPQAGSGGLEQLVQQLSPEQKEQLMQMLEGEPSSAEAVSKGEPSKNERAKIAQASAEENSEQELEAEDDAGPAVDSDEIAMGMLDSRFKNSAPDRPRNLHERVQTNMAKNLKSKGKI